MDEPLPKRSLWAKPKAPAKPAKEKKTTARVEAKPAAQEPEKDSGRKKLRPELPTSPAGIVGNLVARNQNDPNGIPPDAPSPMVKLIATTSQTLYEGGDISPLKEALMRVGTNQPEKMDLMTMEVDEFETHLVPRYVEMIDNSTREVVAASRRGDLAASEAVNIWRMAKADLDEVMHKREKKRGQSNDTVTAVEKIDVARQTVERSVALKWEHTTPQGRELIRKGLLEIKQHITGVKPQYPTIDVQATTVPTPPTPAK